MTTDLLPKTRLLISRSACPRELCDFAESLSTEGYTPASIHTHVIYLSQALARVPRPHDLGPRAPGDIDRAFKPRGGPPTRRKLFEGTRRTYTRFLRARGRVIKHGLKTDSRNFAVSTSSTLSRCAGSQPRRDRITQTLSQTFWFVASGHGA